MTFLVAAFFAGLATLAVPLLLHRMNQRSPAEATVASLMFLREVDEPVRNRRAFAHKALLALRLALLALLVCAFAQPMWNVAAGAGDEESPTAGRLIVVDGSLSMRRRGAWAEALAVARTLQDEAPGPVRLALAADTLTMLDDAAELRAGWGRVDFAALPAALDVVAAGLPEVAGGWRAHLVSDFQATAVPERVGALVGREELWRGARLHRVGGETENWAVESVQVAAERVHAVVASFAQRTRRLRVTLRPAISGDADGNAAGPSTNVSISVAAGARRQVEFVRPALASQPTAWQVGIDDADDALGEDDARRFPLPGTQAAVVGVLAPGGGAAVRFLVAALAANAAHRSVMLDGDAWPERLAAVVALDPGALAASSQRRLQRHLRRGGGLFVIAGPATARHGALPFAGGRLDAGAAATARRVRPTRAGHPLAEIPWDGVTVSRSLTLADAGAQTILSLVPSAHLASSAHRLDAGTEPLLVEKTVGAGRALVLLTALERNWSDLALRPAFVALVGDAVDYLAGDKPLQVAVGAPIAVGTNAARLFDHRGKRLPRPQQGAGAATKQVLRAPRPGVYTVRAPGTETLLAVNVDARESDPRPVSKQFLARWQAALRPSASPPAHISGELGERAAVSLAGWLLALALLCLLAESLAANVGLSARLATVRQ